MSVELVHVYRGSEIESIHRGDVVAVDIDGNIIFSYGDIYKKTFWRSAAKPIQAISLIELGGIKRFGFNNEEISLMASSHGGEKDHQRVLNNLLKKIGRKEDDLECGVTAPMNYIVCKDLLVNNKPFTKGHNPCSGKHSAMLALGILKNLHLKDYILPEHKIQKIILKTICEMAQIDSQDVGIGIDGCGVPVHYLPLYNMAVAYANLGSKSKFSAKRKIAIEKIVDAMISCPFYVAGSKRLDTIIMEETKGRMIAKLGAEGVYNICIINENIGIAVKIEDGNPRALDCIIPEVLFKYGYISEKEFKNINDRLTFLVKNRRGEVVGYLKSAL